MTPYCFIQSIVSISFWERECVSVCVRAQFIRMDAVTTAVAINNRTTSDRPLGNSTKWNMNNTHYYFGSGLEVILRCCYYINWTWYFYLIVNMRFNPIIFLRFWAWFSTNIYLLMVIVFALKCHCNRPYAIAHGHHGDAHRKWHRIIAARNKHEGGEWLHSTGTNATKFSQTNANEIVILVNRYYIFVHSQCDGNRCFYIWWYSIVDGFAMVEMNRMCRVTTHCD